MKTKILLLLSGMMLFFSVSAQSRDYRHSYWSSHERGDFIVSAGYQNFRLQAGDYEAYSINCEYIFNYTRQEVLTVGIRGDMAFGKDYISFAPVGLVVNACLPLFLKSAGGDTSYYILIGLGGLSSLQFHVPVCRFLEVNGGWSAFKITKLKNIGDTYYINGGIGLGLSCFIRNVVINPYYEYNFNYHWLSNKINDWTGSGIEYPKWFNGHTFGIRLGFRFNNALSY